MNRESSKSKHSKYHKTDDYCKKTGKLARVASSPRAAVSVPGGTSGYPAQPRLIRPSVRLSVRMSAHACRLGIEWKMAQAQQIRSIILQNREST